MPLFALEGLPSHGGVERRAVFYLAGLKRLMMNPDTAAGGNVVLGLG